MHELGVAQDLFEIVLNEANKNSIKKVSKIIIKIGEASGIDIDFLKHSFNDHLLPGTIAEKAALEIIKEPVKVKCKDCGATGFVKCKICDGLGKTLPDARLNEEGPWQICWDCKGKGEVFCVPCQGSGLVLEH